VVRIEPFFATAARVVDIDRRRAEGLGLVAGSSGLSEAEAANALNRNNENTAVIEWVCRSLYERAASYRYALERLVISTPSSRAADVELALNLLQSRIAANCPGEHPLVVKG
jgi:fructose-bisphosphate aldolase class 1